jgi:hypothetical protein
MGKQVRGISVLALGFHQYVQEGISLNVDRVAQVRGDVCEFLRNDALDACSFLSQPLK